LANLREPLLEYRLHESSVCSQRSREQERLWEALLQETFRRRGMTDMPPKHAATRRKTPGPGRVRGAWVRAAARGGNYGTALKHAKRLLNEYPFQLATWVTLLRATASTLRPGRIRRRSRRSTYS
jgi:hypothetical protein